MKKALLFSAIVLIATTAFSQSFKEGSEVKAKWGGYWHRGTVVKVKGDKYLVHYTGYGPGYDQWLPAHEIVKFEYKTKAKSTASSAPIASSSTTGTTTTNSASVVPVDSSKIVAKISEPVKKDEQKVVSNSRQPFWKRKNKTTGQDNGPETVKKESEKNINQSVIKVTTVESKDPKHEAKQSVANQTTKAIAETKENGQPSNAKTVSYQGGSAWTNTSSQRMITPDRIGEKLYLCYSVRANALDISTLYLGKDDIIVRNPKLGLNPLDLEKEKQFNGSNAGNYQIDGEKMMINWSDGRTENWRVAYSTMSLYGIDGKMVSVQKAMPPNYQLNGKYEISGLSHNGNLVTIEFSYKGGFITRSNNIAQHASNAPIPPNQRGQYSVNGNTLQLKFESGETASAIICLPVINGKKYLVINNSYYQLQ